ncbi:MAG: RsmB/NOP family class I SAM-dependent RNA methyltransferase [Chlamydiales bacterium]
MSLPFREYHLYQLLEEYEKDQLPLDAAVHNYFRKHKALGSKDRAYLAENVYEMMRHLSLLDFFIDKTPSWSKRFEVYRNLENIARYYEETSIPEHIRFSVPLELYQFLIKSLGQDEAQAFCRASNTQAPLTVRVNTLKTDRMTLMHNLKAQGIAVTPTPIAPHGLIFQKRMTFTALEEFKKGEFEIQDEGSQLVAEMLKAQPGDLVIDYCSGAGGKTLAFAPYMENKGQVYLHDIRKRALYQARKRLKRAGIQNAQVIFSDSPILKNLKKKMDWVMVDAPCSGTGTYRRNPDMKWKFCPDLLKRLIGEQRHIFEKSLSYLKPTGSIVYATCSVLREENLSQVEHFLKTYPLKLIEEPFKSIPTEGGMDGFFAAHFRFI